MKTIERKARNFSRKIFNKRTGAGLFILFSVGFFTVSTVNVNKPENVIVETVSENERLLTEKALPAITPLERNIVSMPYQEEETESTVETTTEVETTIEVETTEVVTEVETETEAEVETEAETETETETETEAYIDYEETVTEITSTENYSSVDEYIYSLINQYSGSAVRVELNYDNVMLLSQLIEAETGDEEPYIGKIAVGEVVLNRLTTNPEYTCLHDVIFKKNQFSVVTYGTIYNTPSFDSISSAVEAILGEAPTDGAIYFDDPRYCTSWASKNRPYGPKIGNHQFYY